MPQGIDDFAETKKGELLTYNVSDQITPDAADYDLKAKRAVIVDASGTNTRPVINAADDSAPYVGVTVSEQGGSNLGEKITVQKTGVAKAEAGGAVTFGASVKATTAGKLIAATTGDNAIGYAEQAAGGDGEFFALFLEPHVAL